MNGNLTLFVDQYGHTIKASTVRELQMKADGGRISKMYKGNKEVVHIGYVVGNRWFTAYTPYEKLV